MTIINGIPQDSDKDCTQTATRMRLAALPRMQQKPGRLLLITSSEGEDDLDTDTLLLMFNTRHSVHLNCEWAR